MVFNWTKFHSGISSQSASDDGRWGKQIGFWESKCRWYSSIFKWYNGKRWVSLKPQTKTCLPYAKHYEIAFVFPYSEDKLNILHKSKLPTGIPNMMQTSADSKWARILGRTFARMMMGIRSKAKSCEAALRTEEQKVAAIHHIHIWHYHQTIRIDEGSLRAKSIS